MDPRRHTLPAYCPRQFDASRQRRPVSHRPRAAVQRSPADVRAWESLAFTSRDAGMPELAAEVHEHAVRLSPRNALAHHRCAGVLLSAGRRRAAVAHLQEAVRLDPGQWYHTYQLGVALAETGDNAAAADCFRRYLEVEPGSGCAWRRLALALYADDKFAEAIPTLEKAVGYSFDSAGPWAALDVSYAETGQHPRGRSAWGELRRPRKRAPVPSSRAHPAPQRRAPAGASIVPPIAGGPGCLHSAMPRLGVSSFGATRTGQFKRAGRSTLRRKADSRGCSHWSA
jgi:tetratricopeptide (TPR) repeat protein